MSNYFENIITESEAVAFIENIEHPDIETDPTQKELWNTIEVKSTNRHV